LSEVSFVRLLAIIVSLSYIYISQGSVAKPLGVVKYSQISSECARKIIVKIG